MINVNNICTDCDPNCLTCSGVPSNCTSCNSNLLLYLNQCLSKCPDYYYENGNSCTSCAAQNIGCGNCSDANHCLSCDVGRVYFG